MIETVAGDTSIGHATAYCQLMEALTGCQVPIRAEVVRGIASNSNAWANHTGDLGALAGDVGFLLTASYCGRIRGDFLNLTARCFRLSSTSNANAARPYQGPAESTSTQQGVRFRKSHECARKYEAVSRKPTSPAKAPRSRVIRQAFESRAIPRTTSARIGT